jgi:hypothetical protein
VGDIVWKFSVPFAQKGPWQAHWSFLESLKDEYILDLDQHRATKGQSQLKGVGKASVQKILARCGENRIAKENFLRPIAHIGSASLSALWLSIPHQ